MLLCLYVLNCSKREREEKKGGGVTALHPLWLCDLVTKSKLHAFHRGEPTDLGNDEARLKKKKKELLSHDIITEKSLVMQCSHFWLHCKTQLEDSGKICFFNLPVNIVNCIIKTSVVNRIVTFLSF